MMLIKLEEYEKKCGINTLRTHSTLCESVTATVPLWFTPLASIQTQIHKHL